MAVAAVALDPPPVVAPTEPLPLRRIGRTSSMPERFGVDVLWTIPRVGGRTVRWGVQRKEWKDLIASVEDGRLAREVQQMTGVGLERAWLCVEGWPRVNGDGALVDKRFGRAWTVHQLRAVIWGVESRGVDVCWSDDVRDTVEMVSRLIIWSRKDKHSTLDARPGPPGSMWGYRGNREWGVWVLQGLQGVGPGLAGKIYDRFGRVPWRWDVGVEELMEIEGIGRKKAEKMMEALSGGRDEGEGDG